MRPYRGPQHHSPANPIQPSVVRKQVGMAHGTRLSLTAVAFYHVAYQAKAQVHLRNQWMCQTGLSTPTSLSLSICPLVKEPKKSDTL